MPTKKEFIRKQKAMASSSNKWSVGSLVVFLGILLANVPLAKFIDHQKTVIWIQVLYSVGFFGFLIGNVPLMMWFRKRQQRRLGVQCPNCGAPLLVHVSAQIVIATGNCGHCGAQILHDS
jgi:ribosomal protein S27E